ncbi:MAG: hypothetical protein NZ561_01865 [Phycisphaerae bacterium]|nr:hypothetical protein [Phycisphaerae bacterium]
MAADNDRLNVADVFGNDDTANGGSGSGTLITEVSPVAGSGRSYDDFAAEEPLTVMTVFSNGRLTRIIETTPGEFSQVRINAQGDDTVVHLAGDVPVSRTDDRVDGAELSEVSLIRYMGPGLVAAGPAGWNAARERIAQMNAE